MSVLPVHLPGTDVVIEERWHGHLWTAVPHRVIHSTPQMLIGWVPAGTRSVYATNRGLPETIGLTRDQRKLLALKTLQARASEFAEEPHKLCLYRADRWCRINLGFAPDDGRFLGWYVDFELPVEPTPTGLVTKDLVLDLWIEPDHSWQWKDRDDLRTAVSEGLIDAGVAAELDREAARILAELAAGSDPFTDAFTGFRPEPEWPIPVLPSSHGWAGTAWSLSPGWRVGDPPQDPQDQPAR
ncbi:MAG TPA: DUF402 domain-containing protein [Microlunatus sp.]